VEAARIFGLSGGIEPTRTVQRLQDTGRGRSLPPRESAAWCEAFETIQRLRLQLNVAQMAHNAAIHNNLDPNTLGGPDRKALKEALRQARNLQGRLASDFSLAGSGRL